MTGYTPDTLDRRLGLVSDPSSPDAIILAGFQLSELCPIDQLDLPPVLAQVVATGNPFRIRLPVLLGGEIEYVDIEGEVTQIEGESADIFQPRRVEVAAGFGGPTASNTYMAAAELTTQLASDLPQIRIATLQPLYDLAFNRGQSLSTVLRHGASVAYYSVDEAVRARGGRPETQIEKPDNSFMFGKAPDKFPRKKI